MDYFNIKEAKDAYKSGQNVTEYLRSKSSSDSNASETIEIAYDLQAGAYIEHATNNMEAANAYASELAALLDPHLSEGKSILDVGTGELTTLSLVLKKITSKVSKAYVFDISWSRLYKGLSFASTLLQDEAEKIVPFVADMKCIPLPSKSVDIVTSNHSLEPNGKNLKLLLPELFRVCRDELVLFEPCYELNSGEGRRRMERLGYIRDIESQVKQLGGSVQDVVALENIANPLNPTVCYIISPPEHGSESATDVEHIGDFFSVPGTNYLLRQVDNYLESPDTGLVFPILSGIPILKKDSGILATAIFE